MRVAIAQIAPVFLDRTATVERVCTSVRDAASREAGLVCFGETLVPAYPLWLCRTDAARFNADDQKELHSAYLREAVTIEDGHLDAVRDAARSCKVDVALGVAERPRDRGQTIYCAAVYIDERGDIRSVHRKLMPTYEERLAWGVGDGAGLVTHRIGAFTAGVLNCWENWMPLARAALYAQGLDLHIALWPGCERLTRDITRFIALESRSYVISASALIRPSDIPEGVPSRERLVGTGETAYYDGGSCIAAPDGSWLVSPVVGREELIVADIDHALVRRERQNFDPAGHYARPDALRLVLDQRRQSAVEFVR